MKLLITTILILVSLSFSSYSEERPNAFLKAQFTEWHKSRDNKDDAEKEQKTTEYKYILQIGNSASYYYDPQTFYVDSLDNDPTGKAIREQALSDALHEFMESGKDAFAIMEEKGLMAKSRYKNEKDFQKHTITVWNSNGADRYQYEVDMNDFQWELCDSTAIVLDYECNLATADYHGRKWKAWFAPEIPVQDGPWQLCGLPGLIMKADTEDGEYGFIITGLQECNESFKPVLIDEDALYKTKRKSYLKMRDHGRRNRSAQISAMSGGKVKLNANANYTGTDDYLETDYHE